MARIFSNSINSKLKHENPLISLKSLLFEALSDILPDDFSKISDINLRRIRLSDGSDKAPEQKAVHYRPFYPQKDAPNRDGLFEEKSEQKNQFVSIRFSLNCDEDERTLKRIAKKLLFSNRGEFCNHKLLSLFNEVRTTDLETPFELSDFRWHQMALETPPNLLPWLSEEQKTLLGISDYSRFKDDPVVYVEDDLFSEYWKDVGCGLPEEKSARCDFNMYTSNYFIMMQCHNALLKLTRSVFCQLSKKKKTKRRFTMLRAPHIFGDAKDHIEETVMHRVYTFVVPDSLRHKIDRAAQEVIALGCDVKLKWSEELD
ncbi:hypothetical protein MHBO_000381 [Bonamia ostreae]|uniref:Uncharacterized protein n=1 Tax=Bonamia ostreae TaxID=126728 RepID=A0ABV2AGA0_9EUKA